MQSSYIEEGKVKAILSYIWWVGLIIAIILNNKDYNHFTAFHIRQALGLSIIQLIANYVLFFSEGPIGAILSIGLFILWMLGLISAIKGEEKPIPLLGEQFQQWFRNI